MNLRSFIAEYFEEHPKFFKDILSLEKQRGLRILGKLNEDPNEINFYSFLSEINFGIFFNDLFTELYYHRKFDRKEPDWTIVSNGQDILIECLRINPPEEKILQRLEEGKELKRFRNENPGVPIFLSSGVQTLSSEYCYSHQSKFTQKEIAYRDIIIQHKLPLILCVASTLDTFLNDLDVFDFLIAHNKRGFFYTDQDFGRNITGVLMRTYYGQFVYFNNEFAQNKLNAQNLEILRDFKYSEQQRNESI